MQTIILDNAPTGRRLIAFWVDAEFPTGEYHLVPVGEACDKDARIAELEKQLAERSPGVMPGVVKSLLSTLTREDGELNCLVASAMKVVRDYYAPPEGYELQPVDVANPITAADVGRKVFHRNGGVDKVGKVKNATDTYRVIVGEHSYALNGRLWLGKESITDITHILRPIAPPFVFDGTPGIYETDSVGTVNLVICKRGNIIILDCGRWKFVNADGTFAGGRITGRVGV